MMMTTKSRKRCLIVVNHILQNFPQWLHKRQQNILFRANYARLKEKLKVRARAAFQI